ncbi:lytic murein transglycosylase [Shimia thalassica]|uniref:lytic murein transglycosylase n=1 Tax=Shimia thalassica TaxID=1715693 RepID=UPI002735BEF9|nr:lytic murein transglycosylase [Shimia thalassica]MDP2519864.1 lytic murein transglycosylase [Shimia thalassica]
MRTQIPAVLIAVGFLGLPALANPPKESLRPTARAQVPSSQVLLASAVVRPVMRPSSTIDAAPAAEPTSGNLGFQRWIDGFRQRALSSGISAKTFDRAFRNVKYNTDVIQKDRNQSEFTKTIWQYLESAASEKRIKNGKAALRNHARTLDAIERQYGVDKEVVVAIWGMESSYGEYKGDYNLIEALATLSYDGRRGKFFEGQLMAALKILQSGDTTPGKMKGSWAGAMGHTQFIPTSYLAYAVDFTGDGKRDIWSNDPTDALASTAAYLQRSGWQKGKPWGVEVKLSNGFNYGLASRKITKSPSQWASLGVTDINGRAVPDSYGSGAILLPAGGRGAAFMVFKNFRAIERYNAADAYVIGVGHLSDRFKGGPPIKGNWPEGDRALTEKERKEMQRRLNRAGFKVGKVDGRIGPNSMDAIRRYQTSKGMTPDGFPSFSLLQAMRNGKGGSGSSSSSQSPNK